MELVRFSGEQTVAILHGSETRSVVEARRCPLARLAGLTFHGWYLAL